MKVALACGVLIGLLCGCDKDPGKGGGGPAATAPPTPAPSRTVVPPALAVIPQLAIDDTAVFVSGERIDVAARDLKGALVAALSGKPVEGQSLVVNAGRDTKMPRMTALFGALIAAKAKGVEVHTAQRDRSLAQLLFVTNEKPGPCSTASFISRDGAITAWPVSGAIAERFTHGMAGPDLTRGSEGIRKRVLACESSVWFVSADDSVPWGLAFDLANAVMHPDDAGLPKARSVSLLVRTPVSGRKVDVDVVP